ncbi:unknown [Prevotella sp. CAG:1124]|nr:unknown [Prevotella sp. CAG:1124]
MIKCRILHDKWRHFINDKIRLSNITSTYYILHST